eukprot:Lankesteria_metandrocarpae@DN7351_c0_g1_i1.p1
MNFFSSVIDDLTLLLSKPRQFIQHILNVACAALGAFMIWKALTLATNCPSPVVVVLSGSMEPAFYRGDVLFLHNPPSIGSGDIAVFQLKGRDIPIVHRVMNVHEDKDGKVKILTKGDNNNIDDRGLYNRGQMWLDRDDVMGVVRAYVPKVGMLTIMMNEHIWMKHALIGSLAFMMLIGKE